MESAHPLPKGSPDTEAAWEMLWAPYDERTYRDVLAQLCSADIVLDIGAGDLRFGFQAAPSVKYYYAIEIQDEILNAALAQQAAIAFALPPNLFIQAGDARTLAFPPGITCAILLMRHCTSFYDYYHRLQSLGCERLMTNARWRSGVEVISLQNERESYERLELGWYACKCGAIGFKPGSVDAITLEVDEIVHEVASCPACQDA